MDAHQKAPVHNWISQGPYRAPLFFTQTASMAPVYRLCVKPTDCISNILEQQHYSVMLLCSCEIRQNGVTSFCPSENTQQVRCKCL